MSPFSEAVSSRLRQDIHQALRHWHTNRPLDSILESLHLVRQAETIGQSSVRHAVNCVLLDALAELKIENPRQATILKMHFVDSLQVSEIAPRLNISEPTINRDQKLGIDRLSEIVETQEQEAYLSHQRVLLAGIDPPSYDSLIGTEAAEDALYALFKKDDTPWLIAVEGIGGIGKTSIAHALTLRCIEEGQFSNVAWITARQENFDMGGGLSSLDRPALTEEKLIDDLLAQLNGQDVSWLGLPKVQKLALLESITVDERHLIVIDNLETVLDVEVLLPVLRHLSNPSKILLTTRKRYDEEPGIYYFALPELSESDTLRLVRQEAEFRNMAHLLEAPDSELRPIYETVGGNPLAIRLIVGQTHVHSLKDILDDLSSARGQAVENLYTYIYWSAWAHLDETTRLVWIQMPLLIQTNNHVGMLSQLTKKEESDVREALATLVKLNLVNAHGSLNERCYSIHNLTRAFLLEGVLKWQ